MFLYEVFNTDILVPKIPVVRFPHNALRYNLSELKGVYDLVLSNYKYKDSCINAKQRELHSFQHQYLYSFYVLNKHHRKINKIPSPYT